MKFIYIGILAFTLSGCQAILSSNVKTTPTPMSCIQPKFEDQQDALCQLSPWIDYWMLVSHLNWKERERQLSYLTSVPADRVKMILLSHVPNTPYQSRLRAQLVAQQFVDEHQGLLARFIHAIVFVPAQEKLELESALSTQTQFNIEQEKLLQSQSEQLSNQAKKLAEQQLQIDKLLQIEKNLVEKPADAKL